MEGKATTFLKRNVKYFTIESKVNAVLLSERSSSEAASTAPTASFSSYTTASDDQKWLGSY